MLPTKDGEVRVWSDSFLTQCETNKIEWGIPTDAVDIPRALCNAYKAALEIAQMPSTRSKATTAAKNEAKKALLHSLRIFIARYINYNDAITSPIRQSLGLPVKDKKWTPVPVPTSYPEFFIKLKDIRSLSIHFKPMGSSRKAKPYGYNGAIISYAVLDKPPKRPEDLTNAVLATRTPYTLTFSEADRGKRVYLALVWENEKGEIGPYSQIEEAFIP